MEDRLRNFDIFPPSRRIYEILPHRLQHWQTAPCISEENNKKELDRIRKQQFEAREALTRLDKRHQELDAAVERGKLLEIDSNLEVRFTISCFHFVPVN